MKYKESFKLSFDEHIHFENSQIIGPIGSCYFWVLQEYMDKMRAVIYFQPTL